MTSGLGGEHEEGNGGITWLGVDGNDLEDRDDEYFNGLLSGKSVALLAKGMDEFRFGLALATAEAAALVVDRSLALD